MSFLLSMLLGAAEAATPATPVVLVEPDPKVMSQKQIRAFNANLDKKHPFYIRCVSSPEIGSLVKRLYSCRTNRQWEASDETGNRNARETYEAMQGKFWNTSE
ncbi:hypothetical protein [Novosphingobium sp. TH158]|uniref:hypothetical protein n=1 Tax=Novosphingobium sp. TH158 TaxID=2067455 RepID=UPI000C7C7E07|nr:hypothetical protein [Novosphingobium sp. TH158]PLK27271.1 hypothetical protein C0V78_10505 [Novosphingobium sp. TH158]